MILATMVSIEGLFFVSLLSLLINIFLIFAVFAIAASLSDLKNKFELKNVKNDKNDKNDKKVENNEDNKTNYIDKNAPIEQQVKQMLAEDIEQAKNEYDECTIEGVEIAKMVNIPKPLEEIPLENTITPPNKKQYALPPAKTIHLQPMKNQLELFIQRAFIENISPIEKANKVLTISNSRIHDGNDQRRESDSLHTIEAEVQILPVKEEKEKETKMEGFNQEELKMKNLNQLKKLAKELGINIYHFHGRGKHMRKNEIIDSILKL